MPESLILRHSEAWLYGRMVAIKRQTYQWRLDSCRQSQLPQIRHLDCRRTFSIIIGQTQQQLPSDLAELGADKHRQRFIRCDLGHTGIRGIIRFNCRMQTAIGLLKVSTAAGRGKTLLNIFNGCGRNITTAYRQAEIILLLGKQRQFGAVGK